MSTHNYLTSSQVAMRYSKSHRTIMRWIESRPEGFPAPIKINGRHSWRASDLEEWEKALAATAASGKPEAA